MAQPPRPCDKSQPIAAAEGGKLAARGCAKGCACGPAGVLVAWRAHMALCRVFEAEKMTFGLHRRRHEAILEVRGRGRKRERGGARGAKWRNLVATFAQQIARRKDGAAAGGPDLHRRQRLTCQPRRPRAKPLVRVVQQLNPRGAAARAGDHFAEGGKERT